MTLDVRFAKIPGKNSDAIVLCFYKDENQPIAAETLNGEIKSFAAYVSGKIKSFKGKHGQSEIVMMPEGFPYSYIVLLGLGEREKFNPVQAENAGGKLFAALSGRAISSVDVFLEQAGDAAALANGLILRSYVFEHYKVKKTGDDKPPVLTRALIVLGDTKGAEKIYADYDAVTKGVFFARDLVNEPPNVLYPDAYAKRISDQLAPLGVEIEILDDKKMLKLGMGAIMAVGQGSDRLPRMVVMRWRGNKGDKGAPLAFVGKGVTFDTGGISLKPGPGMEEMKMDMGGSAAVVGFMQSLALRKAKVNVVGIVGLAENMPSARAYRPADIITSYNGKKIEVLNTDAEGRLVLADCLSYVQEKYKPRLIVDLATLTGAMIVALGHEYCGTFCTDDAMWANLDKAGKDTGEKLWRMPLDELWKTEMEGTITDVQNMAKSGRDAGSCTAAGFLWHFIEGDTPWAHMDIAGTAWIKKDRDVTPKYGTGFGVRALSRFVADNYEV